MMRLKLQKSFIVVFLLGIFLYGCIEEPFIEPVKRPFSVLRVGNFSSNQDVLTVLVDGKEIGNLAKNTLTDYMDFTSGARLFVLKDANGNEIFNKAIDLGSYEEQTLAFAGYYSTVDTLNSFGFSLETDGYTYKYEIPDADHAGIVVVNLVTDTPTETASAISIVGISTDSTRTDTVKIAGTKFMERNGVQDTLGTRNFTFDSDGADTTKVELSVDLANQKKYFFFITGNPLSFEVVKDEQSPLPARSK